MRRSADPAVSTAVRAVRAVALLLVAALALVIWNEVRDDDDPDDPAAALVEAEGRQRATVLLVSRRTVDAVARVAERGDVEIDRLVVTVDGSDTDVVGPDDLAGWVDRRRAELQGERDALAEVAATVDPGDEFAAVYAADLRALDDTLARLSPDAEVVQGFEVEAPAATLRALAARADVASVTLSNVG